MLEAEDTKTIRSHKASSPSGAVIDALQRSAKALDNMPDAFTHEHLAVVDEVRAIVDSFFRVKNGIYVNHRVNRGKPFSVVKVDRPMFPRVSHATKQKTWREPLEALGVEIVFSKGTNSYLFRIPT